MAYTSKVQMTEANDDWLRASRLKREGKLEELAQMEATEMVALDSSTIEYEEDEEDQ